MLKRTLFFGNPVYLGTRQKQLYARFPEEDKEDLSIPIEDLGIVVLEHPQITVTSGLTELLVKNNVALIFCDKRHMPIANCLPYEAHTEQSERYKLQLEASQPLKKNLWQQTVKAKIQNQAAHLSRLDIPVENMLYWVKSVNSGDTQNHEGRAAAYYWRNIFPIPEFTRHRGGDIPNNLLNYGYAILRAITARAIVGSGLLPALGIHHRNKYNAYCLADDLMEPYRPYVDMIVRDIYISTNDCSELSKDIKQQLLQLPVIDVFIEGKKSPLMVALSRTTNSIYECYAQQSRKLVYPQIIPL